MGALAPAFLAGLAAIAIPVLIHMIHRERKETIAFPSLMFLRKIPYRSVRRQKLRHLLLLALRALAVAIVVSAFARPFLRREVAVAGGPDGRAVVILLDRSYSMAYGTRWPRALDAIRTVARGIGPGDEVSLVAFGTSAEQVTPAARSPDAILAALGTIRPTSEATRVAAGLRMAAHLLAASELPRKEIVLVSDFHRSARTPNDDVALPPRATVRSVDVSRGETEDVAVAGVAVARQRAGGRARAVVTARVTNLGKAARAVDATLEIGGRRADTRRVTVTPRSAAQVAFAGVQLGSAPTRAVVRLAGDSQPANDAFHFTIVDEPGASALILEPRGARQNQSLYLARALAVADDPAVDVDVRSSATADDLRDRSLVVVNETALPSGEAGRRLRAAIADGGAMLLLAPGEHGLGVPGEWQSVLPARVGSIVDRPGAGARWGAVDFSSPLFEPLRAARVDFSSVRVSRYRALEAAEGAQVIARLDDGAPLLVVRPLGAGRVVMIATTLDGAWTDLPFHPLWVPLAHRLALGSGAKDTRTWYVASHVLDLGTEGRVVVESPSGALTRLGDDSTRRGVELRERGFYEVRREGTAIGAGRPVAVNVDLAESDLSHADPAELVAAITARATGVDTTSRAETLGTAQELEQRQAVWWYLLLAALLVLAAETLLANRGTPSPAGSAGADNFTGRPARSAGTARAGNS